MTRHAVEPQTEHIGASVLDAAFAVHRAVGPGLRERHYANLLQHALERRGHTVQREVCLDVEFEGLRLANALRMDMVVDDKVLVEIKARESALEYYEAQVLTYLLHSGKSLAFLINFRAPYLKQGLRRFVNTPSS